MLPPVVAVPVLVVPVPVVPVVAAPDTSPVPGPTTVRAPGVEEEAVVGEAVAEAVELVDRRASDFPTGQAPAVGRLVVAHRSAQQG